MTTASSASFRNHTGEHLDTVQRNPATITHRGQRRAVVVSVDFYDRAVHAMEDLEDIRTAAAARAETGTISHEEILGELGVHLSE